MSCPFHLKFDNQIIHSLPLDPLLNHDSRQVPGSVFSRVKLEPLLNPVTVSVSEEALRLIDVDLKDVAHPEFAQYFSAGRLFDGSEPAAHCYCGHQFGEFAGQLGDGAAKYLGEVVNIKGERWEIQVKGAGPTPYSRNSDGRKVLRSSIREYLCSEAMFHLNIPTTRAACIITSDSRVPRDLFYTGRNIRERCSTVMRIAQTFIRFGSFEISNNRDARTGASGPSVKSPLIVKQLLDYVIQEYFPQINHDFAANQDKKYLEFFKEVCIRTCDLVSLWQSVGFCHGVLNTDNMSIYGLTLDYGPFGFLEQYYESHVCNHSDHHGRYTYAAQPAICRWNCSKLAVALQNFIPLSQSSSILDQFDANFKISHTGIFRRKLGIIHTQEQDDDKLIQLFLNTMQQTAVDFTQTFRLLSRFGDEGFDLVEKLVDMSASLETLLEQCEPTLKDSDFQMVLPIFQQAPSSVEMFGLSPTLMIAEIDKRDKRQSLLSMQPATLNQRNRQLWQTVMTQYAERLARDDAVSLQSMTKEIIRSERKAVMNKTNPAFVLRNYLLQSAIEKAEKGDYSGVEQLLTRAKAPFNELPEDFLPSPEWAADVCVSCSS